LGEDDAMTLTDAGWALVFVVCDLEAGAALIDSALAQFQFSLGTDMWRLGETLALGESDTATSASSVPCAKIRLVRRGLVNANRERECIFLSRPLCRGGIVGGDGIAGRT
jgi:hypothetical protein